MDYLLIADSDDLRVETAADPATEGVLLVALVAEEVHAGFGEHSDVTGVVADGTDFSFAVRALRVFLGGGICTRTVVP